MQFHDRGTVPRAAAGPEPRGRPDGRGETWDEPVKKRDMASGQIRSRVKSARVCPMTTGQRSVIEPPLAVLFAFDPPWSG